MIRELREHMNRRSVAFILTALLIVGTISLHSVLAYFSDYAAASGSKDITLEWQTKLNEDVKDNNKHITIENVGETPVIVRVQVFANEELADITGTAWNHVGDWWYYSKVLEAGQTIPDSEELLVTVAGPDDLPDSAFNIIVVHESSRVVYEDNSNLAKPEGWTYVPAV